MFDPACPWCAGREWIREDVVVAPGLPGELHLSSAAVDGPPRWTCSWCGYEDRDGGPVSVFLDEAYQTLLLVAEA